MLSSQRPNLVHIPERMEVVPPRNLWLWGALLLVVGAWLGALIAWSLLSRLEPASSAGIRSVQIKYTDGRKATINVDREASE